MRAGLSFLSLLLSLDCITWARTCADARGRGQVLEEVLQESVDRRRPLASRPPQELRGLRALSARVASLNTRVPSVCTPTLCLGAWPHVRPPSRVSRARPRAARVLSRHRRRI
eukprot:3632340-Rhodomonas_salina.1